MLTPRLFFRPAVCLVPVVVLSLAACAPQNRASLSPGFGNATQHNFAMQVINPTPANLDRMPDHSGARAAMASTRYHTDTIKEAEQVITTD